MSAYDARMCVYADSKAGFILVCGLDMMVQ